MLRKGTVKSTHPSFIAIRYDFVSKRHPQAKVFLRSCLYSTSKRGIVVENLFLNVIHDGKSEEFSFWGYGEKDLSRGSGLFVGENGVVTNHHFNPLNANELYAFNPGIYKIELMAKLVGRKSLLCLSKISLEVPKGAFEEGVTDNIAIYYNWSPLEQKYIASIEDRNEQLSGFLESSANNHFHPTQKDARVK